MHAWPERRPVSLPGCFDGAEMQICSNKGTHEGLAGRSFVESVTGCAAACRRCLFMYICTTLTSPHLFEAVGPASVKTTAIPI